MAGCRDSAAKQSAILIEIKIGKGMPPKGAGIFVLSKQEVSMSDNPLRYLPDCLTSCNTRRLASG